MSNEKGVYGVVIIVIIELNYFLTGNSQPKCNHNYPNFYNI